MQSDANEFFVFVSAQGVELAFSVVALAHCGSYFVEDFVSFFYDVRQVDAYQSIDQLWTVQEELGQKLALGKKRDEDMQGFWIFREQGQKSRAAADAVAEIGEIEKRLIGIARSSKLVQERGTKGAHDPQSFCARRCIDLAVADPYQIVISTGGFFESDLGQFCRDVFAPVEIMPHRSRRGTALRFHFLLGAVKQPIENFSDRAGMAAMVAPKELSLAKVSLGLITESPGQGLLFFLSLRYGMSMLLLNDLYLVLRLAQKSIRINEGIPFLFGDQFVSCKLRESC